jgi:predicted outer membrane repeat protein
VKISVVERRLSTLIASLVLGASAAASNVWRVDATAAPGGDGTSWSTAFAVLDDALANPLLAPGDSIWIAAGVYRPARMATPPDPRSVSFLIPPQTTVIGGFLGSESTPLPLGPPASTILSGALGSPSSVADDAYHVLSFPGVNVFGVVVRNVTVEHGNAVGSGGNTGGALIAATGGSMFVDCVFDSNLAGTGGAIYATGHSLALLRCRFTNNRARHRAGAITGITALITAHACRFEHNYAGEQGGALSLISIPSDSTTGEPLCRFANCVFDGNTTRGDGGAVVLRSAPMIVSGKASFTGCTFARNVAVVQGAAVTAETATTLPAVSWLRSCIVWGNSAPLAPQLSGTNRVVRSIVEGGWPGPGNSALDPLLTPALELGLGSPAIDAGDNTLIANDAFDLDGDGNGFEPTPFDCAGNPRRVDVASVPDTGLGTAPIVDLGAFEHP